MGKFHARREQECLTAAGMLQIGLHNERRRVRFDEQILYFNINEIASAGVKGVKIGLEPQLQAANISQVAALNHFQDAFVKDNCFKDAIEADVISSLGCRGHAEAKRALV